jgi:hypothetical protein
MCNPPRLLNRYIRLVSSNAFGCRLPNSKFSSFFCLLSCIFVYEREIWLGGISQQQSGHHTKGHNPNRQWTEDIAVWLAITHRYVMFDLLDIRES